MSYRLKRCFFIFFLFFSCFKISKADGTPSTLMLGIEKGLSNNSVRSIIRDSKGIMWFGTRDGLNRYDGYDFKIYRNDLSDPNSVPHNFIYALEEDLEHNLWVGTGQGIGIFNYLTSKFVPLRFFSKPNKAKQILRAQINVIKRIGNGDILVGTNGSGLMVKANHQDVAVQLPIVYQGRVIFDYSVTAIKNLGSQQVLLFIEPAGLCLYDVRTRKIKIIDQSLNNAYCIDTDQQNNVWISATSGLYLYNLKKQTLRYLNNNKQSPLNSEHVLSMNYDVKTKLLWIGTKAEGLQVINAFNGSSSAVLPRGTASGQSVDAIFSDPEGRKWIATSRNGVTIIDPKASKFITITQNPLAKSTLINNFASSFLELPSGKIMIGTDGGGISLWDRQRNEFFNIKANTAKRGSLSSNSVTNIKQDAFGDIWIATFGGGVNRVKKGGWNFERYNLYSVAGKENENVWQILEGRDKTLWATTFAQGMLYYFNRTKDRFEILDEKFNENLFAVFEDKDGVLWGGNANALIKIDRKDFKHQYFEIGKPVRVIYEDTNGSFWIGSEGGGLLEYDRKNSKIIKRFSTANGLSNNSILSIMENKSKGELWISTYSGLSRFNIKNRTFYNYYSDDGLQSNQFLDNASLILRSGEFVFGGIKGLNVFYPDSVRMKGKVPPLVINDIKVNNQPVYADNPFVVKTGLDQIEKMEIPFNDASIVVDFAAIDYSAPGKITYAYFLEGWDKRWNFSKKVRTAAYTKLVEGTYILRIRSTDTEGKMVANDRIIQIRILPPWYRSWWAYSLYLILASSIFYVFQTYHNRQRSLKHEVEITNLQMEREKDLNEKKLNFFTNISHELRTPLTLIVNPIKDILNKKDAGSEKNDLNIVYRNSRRLLSLVDQLLLFRKSESENDTLNIVKINLHNFANEIFLCFGYLARINHINYTFECENKELYVYADRDKIEIVLFNLLSNALKFTPKGGFVQLIIRDNQDQVFIEVGDSGPGIPEEVGERLFDKFYKVMSKESLKMGFGIGLYLAKNFIELHRGKISFISNAESGTTFIVVLPVNQTQEVCEQTIVENDLSYINELITQEQEIETGSNDEIENLELLISDLHSILVIDDNAETIDYIHKIFRGNFKLYKAENGLDGLRLCKEYMPDIVISDVNMDGLNGIALCKAIKEDSAISHIPVILLTADPSPEIKLQGIEVGAYDFIGKPFDKELFMAKINGIIKNRLNLQSYFFNEVTLKSETQKISEDGKVFLQSCITIIEENLMEDTFSVKLLASELGMSHSKLYKKIKSTSGQSINGFIRYIRLRRAAELLINTNLNISEAAFRVGINDIKYFRENFQKLFKLTPSEFIKKHRKNFHKHYSINA